ncbi:MAG TPA: hypothetical protein VJ853_06780 [Thermoanaerobaculia bacterium]|nr:hypothetical protein [Thermoanaerobaculia bacterium]
MSKKRWLAFAILQTLGVLQIAGSQIASAHNMWGRIFDPLSLLTVFLFYCGWLCMFLSIVPFLIKPRQMPMAACAVVLLFIEGAGACTSMRYSMPRRQDWLVLSDATAAVSDARAMIAAYKEDRSLQPAELPASLQIANLRYALVHRDHLDLVVLRQVDEESGFRIWAPAARPHEDTPTKYRDVFYYSYSDDFADSPKNIY